MKKSIVLKRVFDVFFSTVGLVFLFPVLLLISAWIKMESNGPVFFFQDRVGLYGKLFRIIKFRTMVPEAELKGLQITVGCDPRITSVGHFLRHYKLDELPQLLNVIIGEMSIVGPRPEVPRYVDLYSKHQRDLVTSVLPGITDFASLKYKDENNILGRAKDPEKTYKEVILPEKLKYYERYVNEQSIWLDFRLILATVTSIFLKN